MPKSTWCIVANAFEPIVSKEIFDQAQMILASRTIFKTDEQLLDSLRRLLAREGRLSQKLISQTEGVPSPQAYKTRFGSLRKAFELIGYRGHNSSVTITETRRKLAAMKRALVEEIVATFPAQVTIEQQNWRERLRLRLRDRSIVCVHLSRPPQRKGESLKWLVDTGQAECCKFSLIARLNDDRPGFYDFHLMPCFRRATRMLLVEDDNRLRTGIRFRNVSAFLSATKRQIAF